MIDFIRSVVGNREEKCRPVIKSELFDVSFEGENVVLKAMTLERNGIFSVHHITVNDGVLEKFKGFFYENR